MTKRRNNEVFERIKNQMDFEQAIVQDYKSCKFMTKHIARTYGVTPQTVQRIAKKWGVLRTRSESMLMLRYIQSSSRIHGAHKVSKSRGNDNQLKQLRAIVVSLMKEQNRDFSRCELCGKNIPGGQFEIHHTKYEGSTFQDLRIVCQSCNHLAENKFLA